MSREESLAEKHSRQNATLPRRKSLTAGRVEQVTITPARSAAISGSGARELRHVLDRALGRELARAS